MKHFLLALLTFVTFSCTPRLQSTAELKPPFANQGEQENYWAQEFFKNEYSRTEYPKYEGTMLISTHGIIFGEQYIEYSGSFETELNFKKGLIYPQLMGLTNMKIGLVEELSFLSNNPTVKRFRFIHFDRTLGDMKLANPQVYLFELQNDNFKGNESLTEFIENARLTFLKAGWVMI